MKRAAAFLTVVLFALPLAAAEKWWDAYNKGVKAVNAKQYQAGADALQRAIAEMPEESNATRTRNEIITYVPHFFLGIAKFNLGDVDGALREWKTSEDQAAIQNTDYYARLKEWVARANTEKQRIAQTAAAGSKKSADVALNRALSGQMEAVSAGGDRSDNYRSAQKKLQEALEQFNKGGSDVRAYNRAGDLAVQARDLFAAAVEEAKRPKVAAPAPTPAPVPTPPVIAARPRLATTTVPEVALPQPAVESEARAAARIALQKHRQRLTILTADAQYAGIRADLQREEILAGVLESRLTQDATDAALQQLTADVASRERQLSALLERAVAQSSVMSEAQSVHSDLESAYRAFASGNLATSEDLLTRILTRTQSSEAYLLRGCTRYTRAMLSTKPDDLLVGASLDFREALKINRSLRLDASSFSPKLVAFFEQVRRSG
ncbi:MAG: hypothetical protein ACXVIJ_08420 [Thermoanaerobaculia bacterium]